MKRLIAVFVGLSAIDIILTLWLVVYGGGTEFNPIMVAVLSWPLPAIIAYKVGVPFIVGLTLYILNRRYVNKFFKPARILRIVVIAFVAVCVFNISGMLK